MKKLTWAQVCASRLARHGLSTPLTGGPAEVVSAMASTHAQVMSAAELAIGLRLADATRQTVREALWERGELVKTFGPRGTVHLLPAAEYANWVAALAAVPLKAVSVPAHVGMTAEQTEKVLAAIESAVTAGPLTVDELTDAVVASAGSWAGDPVMEAFGGKWPRWRQALHLAGMRGLVCFGPNRGRLTTYTSPGPLGRVTGDPIDWLLDRYLHAFGPATPARFANWLTAPDAWARDVFASAGLTRVLVDDEELWARPSSLTAPAEPPKGVRLLPYFDAYAYAVGNDRPRLYPGVAATKAKGNFQVLLVDGVVRGRWHQKRSGRNIRLTVEPFVRLTAAQRGALAEQADRVGTILEGTPELTFGEVTVGGHA